MKRKDPTEKSIKRSVSFPPEMWEFVEQEAGEYGNASPVVQKAVKLLKAFKEGGVAALEKFAQSADSDLEKASHEKESVADKVKAGAQKIAKAGKKKS